MAIMLHHINFSYLYVKNYGYVPYAKCDGSRMKIIGLVKRPTILTMQYIYKFPQPINFTLSHYPM